MRRAEAQQAQMGVKREAADQANARMRREVLPRLQVDASLRAMLAGEWNPFEADPGDGFQAALRTTDALVIQVMRDPGTLKLAKGIYRDEVQRAMFAHREHTPKLLQSVIEDLIAPGGGALYAVER